MLVKVVKKEALDIPSLWRAVLKFIYEPENMAISEIDRMQHSIVFWTEKISLDRDMGMVNEEEAYALQRFGWYLKKNEEGAFEGRKRLFASFNPPISYKKFHRLPEAYKPEDFIRAQAEYEKLKALNPEENPV